MRINNRLRKLHRLQREIVWLALIALVLGAILLIAWGSEDRKAPQITFSNEAITAYSIGQSEDALLRGVIAKDNRDGDISSKVIVYQTRMVSSEEMTIIYQVRDSHGNLTQTSKTCKVVPGGDITEPSTDPVENSSEAVTDSTEETTSEIVTLPDYSEAPTENTEPTETEEPTETIEPTEPTEPEPTEAPTEKPTEPPTEPVTEPERPTVPAPVLAELQVTYLGGVKYAGDLTSAAEFAIAAIYSDGTKIDNVNGWGSNEVGRPLAEGQNILYFFYENVIGQYELVAKERPEGPIDPPKPPVNNGIPVLTLNTNEVHVKAGTYFHYRKCIDQLYDDKDPEPVLRERIRVEGWDKFSTSKKGVYVLKISVLDTDKNRSAISILTVYVE